MKLSDTDLCNAKQRDKPYRLLDGDGLFLLVQPNGKKWWRFAYSYQGKRQTISFGTYPETTLKAARVKRTEARAQVSAGINPSAKRQAEHAAKTGSAANSFEVVAREWFLKYQPVWSESHSKKTLRRLERDIFPWLGALAIDEIKAPALLEALRRIEERGAVETAHRALQNAGQIFRYAIAAGRAERGISADLRGALSPVYKVVASPPSLSRNK